MGDSTEDEKRPYHLLEYTIGYLISNIGPVYIPVMID